MDDDGDESPPLGKIAPDFFDRHVAPNLGADRSDVALGPTHGVDFGLLDVDGTAMAVATDPLSVLPALGFERAGRFALDIVLADVAVSGLSPSHLCVGFTLPPEMRDEEFAALWRAIDREASALGVSVVTGHTARYAECSYPWVGAATAMAVGDHGDVVRPDGLSPGDELVVTKGPGVEATGLLTTLFPDAFDLPAEVLATAQARLDEARCVRDAATAAAAGPVTAMHDATEGGLQGALCEVAAGAGVRLDVDRAAVPLRPGVAEVCAYLDVDPWTVTTAGTLVVGVAEGGGDAVVRALEDRGTPAAVVGRASDGAGVYLDDERVEHPRTDPSWAAYERLAGE
jgi:hydrogenase maturation factor